MHALSEPVESKNGTFWTLCPYCYYLYQYDFVYVDCCLKCRNCRKPFHGVAVAAPPPGVVVEGKEEYNCAIGCFSLEYDLGTSSSLDNKKGENLGVRVSPSKEEKKGGNEGFEINFDNYVLISDDDSDCDVDCGIRGKEECKNEKNCNVETEGEIVKNGDETEPVLLQRNLGENCETKTKRKMNVKVVMKNTKKMLGRGISYLGGIQSIGNSDDTKLKEEVGESQPENTSKNGSEDEEGCFDVDDYLDFSFGDDDDEIYVSLKSI